MKQILDLKRQYLHQELELETNEEQESDLTNTQV